MKKNCFYLFFVALMFPKSLFSQVGINTNNIEDGVTLQIESANKGVLFPRVALISRTSTNPLNLAIPTGTIVFNTVTAGTFPNSVTPGLQYWSAEDKQWTNFNVNLKNAVIKYTNQESTTNYNTNSWQNLKLFGNLIFNESGSVYKVDNASQSLTVKIAGLYSISSLLSFDRKDSDDPGRLSLTAQVFINGSPTGTEQVISPGYTTSINADRGLFSHSFTEYLPLNAGDVISIRIKRTSGIYASGFGTAAVNFKQNGDSSIAILRIR